MAQLIGKKVQASSLIEVLVAMVIIMIVFALAMSIFNNILRGGVSFREIRVQGQLNLYTKQVMEKGLVENEFVELEDISYQFITDTSGVEGIYRLEIRATQAGKLLGTAKSMFKGRVDEN